MTEEMKTLVQGLSELRETVESKNADSAEAKEKIAKIEKELGDIHAETQKNFEIKAAEEKAKQAEIDLLKEKLDNLAKKELRIGAASDDSSLYKKYSQELGKYLRKGIEPSSEILEEVATDLVEKGMNTAS